MTKEEVIELSVDETNKLRAKLGLPPLRIENAASNQSAPSSAAATTKGQSSSKEVLELSVDESNALREKLGLAPLRDASSKKKKAIVHAPAANQQEQEEARERIERARLQRQVQSGMSKFTAQGSLGEEKASAKSWAKQMRSQQSAKKKAKKKKVTASESQQKYDEQDLQGMTVGHATSELAEGSTTVLTLADTAILDTDDTSKKVLGINTDDVRLENVNLAQEHKQQQGLKEKRKVEMGMGRAGGYAGFDDDEFEELGGTQEPSRSIRGGVDRSDAGKKPKVRGFQIGALLEQQEAEQESDLFAGQEGKAVSLEPSQADVVAADFLSVEEDEAMRLKKRQKKEKFKKKDKKKKKKKKSRKSEEDEEEEEDTRVLRGKKGGRLLLDELEETAVEAKVSRKRRRSVDEEAGDSSEPKQGASDSINNGETSAVDKRAKFEAIMAKGNERTRAAFGAKTKEPVADLDDEPDDAFLNAALAKARRLNRLKELSGAKKATSGADMVVEAVQSSRKETAPETAEGSHTVTFTVDDTSEFTRALRAREEQIERKQAKKLPAGDEAVKQEPSSHAVATVNEEDQEMPDIAELAEQVKEEEITESGTLDGTTGNDAPIGQGLGGVLGLLKQSGELTRKNAGKEEMRGRAKDERTYEDYDALDLSKVVKIDDHNATSKDKEMARREIKLEYRDKRGRLLTRKEAFRDLSYQFHGYGSGKRKEEKRNEQIAREQAETRLASRQAAEGGGAGTFGALKATQQATGKAFVVHKTS